MRYLIKNKKVIQRIPCIRLYRIMSSFVLEIMSGLDHVLKERDKNNKYEYR